MPTLRSQRQVHVGCIHLFQASVDGGESQKEWSMDYTTEAAELSQRSAASNGQASQVEGHGEQAYAHSTKMGRTCQVRMATLPMT